LFMSDIGPERFMKKSQRLGLLFFPLRVSILPSIIAQYSTKREKGLLCIGYPSAQTSSKKESLPSFSDIPFVIGNVHVLVNATLLFLAVIFSRARNVAVVKQFGALFQRLGLTRGRWRSIAVTQNFLRALVVKTDLATEREMKTVVRTLERMQGMSGLWQGNINPYLTVNALGHLNMPEAARQTKKAFACLVQTQNRNGTWGRVRQEWSTFLVMHALKRKAYLLKTPDLQMSRGILENKDNQEE